MLVLLLSAGLVSVHWHRMTQLRQHLYHTSTTIIMTYDARQKGRLIISRFNSAGSLLIQQFTLFDQDRPVTDV